MLGIAEKIRDPIHVCICQILFSSIIDSALHAVNSGKTIDQTASAAESCYGIDECNAHVRPLRRTYPGGPDQMVRWPT